MSFKRDFYYEIKNYLSEYNVVFVLGPRKCGKTFALLQLKENYGEIAEYVDFKGFSEEESMEKINAIAESIEKGEDKIYLLDEATYIFFPEAEIEKIALKYNENNQKEIDSKTKIVFTGSQSLALETWGRLSFCNQAAFVKTSFLTYSEWMKYKNRTDIGEESYLAFLQGTFEFYRDFKSLEDYLSGCLNETVISNSKARNYIRGNACDLVDVDNLIDILYITLFSLHDQTSAANFFKTNAFADKVVYISRQLKDVNPLSTDDIRDRIAKSCVYKYDNVKALDIEVIKQSFAFLIRIGLVVATPVCSDFEHSLDVLKALEATDSVLKKKEDLFSRVNFTIKYPMFFVEILKEIFKENLPLKLDGYILGSIVECHVRGLLPIHSVFEYHDEQDREIDYVNRQFRTAIEITIDNKRMNRVHLDLIDESEQYRKILLSKNLKDKADSVELIPYTEFIYELSDRGERYLEN